MEWSVKCRPRQNITNKTKNNVTDISNIQWETILKTAVEHIRTDNANDGTGLIGPSFSYSQTISHSKRRLSPPHSQQENNSSFLCRENVYPLYTAVPPILQFGLFCTPLSTQVGLNTNVGCCGTTPLQWDIHTIHARVIYILCNRKCM